MLYGLNLHSHINVAKCYIALGITNSKIKELQHSENVYDRIKLGVLYIESGEARKGVNVLDEVCANEPDLLITPALRQYINQVIKDKL